MIRVKVNGKILVNLFRKSGNFKLEIVNSRLVITFTGLNYTKITKVVYEITEMSIANYNAENQFIDLKVLLEYYKSDTIVSVENQQVKCRNLNGNKRITLQIQSQRNEVFILNCKNLQKSVGNVGENHGNLKFYLDKSGDPLVARLEFGDLGGMDAVLGTCEYVGTCEYEVQLENVPNSPSSRHKRLF